MAKYIAAEALNSDGEVERSKKSWIHQVATSRRHAHSKKWKLSKGKDGMENNDQDNDFIAGSSESESSDKSTSDEVLSNAEVCKHAFLKCTQSFSVLYSLPLSFLQKLSQQQAVGLAFTKESVPLKTLTELVVKTVPTCHQIQLVVPLSQRTYRHWVQ